MAVEICPGQVPILDGAEECSRQGVASSLYAQNALVQEHTLVTTSTAGELFPLLVDPQTGGHTTLSCDASLVAACIVQSSRIMDTGMAQTLCVLMRRNLRQILVNGALILQGFIAAVLPVGHKHCHNMSAFRLHLACASRPYTLTTLSPPM